MQGESKTSWLIEKKFILVEKMIKNLFLQKRQEKEKNTALNAINLLVGILVRYPEIGTVRFDPNTQCLQFSYTMEASILKDLQKQGVDLTKELTVAIKGYHRLNKIYAGVLKVSVEEFAQFVNLTIQRDLKSFISKEISFILALLYQTIPGFFTIDALDRNDLEDQTFPEEMLSVILENMNHVSGEKKIVAFRDRGKVLFYNE